MLRIRFLFLTLLLLQACSSSSVFELSPNQSMLLLGKGEGQDAAINPYSDETTIATIKNKGKRTFSARVQANGKVKRVVAVDSKRTIELTLEPGDELYLDSAFETKAKVTFEPKEE